MVVLEVGLVKETEKAVLVSFWTSGNYRGFLHGEKYEVITAWLPKSQINLLSEREKYSSYMTYSNLKANHMGLISEGTCKRNLVKTAVKLEIPAWLYKKSLTYATDI